MSRQTLQIGCVIILSLVLRITNQGQSSNSFIDLSEVEGEEQYYGQRLILEYFTREQDSEETTLLAIVKQRFAIRKTFQLLDSRKKLIATATRRILALGEKFDITNKKGETIGLINERFSIGIFTMNPLQILDAKQNLIGLVKYKKYFNIYADVFQNDEKVAKMERKIGLLTGKWSIQWLQPNLDQTVKIMHLLLPPIISNIYTELNEKQQE